MRINENVAAFNAYRHITKTSAEMGTTMERLSSSFQINKASDDAAGLVRSENLRTEISSTIQALHNAQDGISFLQTTEGALSEATALLQRMRTLAISGASTASGSAEAQQIEFSELLNEFEAMGQRTTFGGIATFQDFTAQPLVFHIGTASTDRLEIDGDLRLEVATFDGGSLAGLDLTADADAAVAAVDSSLATLTSIRAGLGAKQNRLEQAIGSLRVAQENLSASESQIRDTDMALEMTKLSRHQVMTQAGTAMLAQANIAPESLIGLLGR